MFGLMRPERKCGKSCSDWTRTHRMHYCGTCKAIGTQYGHQARLFLNFDIVFLSELLSDLNREKMDEWTDAYQSINQCFSMPTELDNTPFPLQYTATANTILSALKVDDNIKDQKQLRWYATRKFYSRSFRKAFEQMEAWGTPKEDFFHWIDLQVEREESIPKEKNDLFDYLTFYAEPTAELTALIFEKGIEQIQPIHQAAFKTLGYNFGLLMYVLDAFEDLENDIFTKQFNPLTHWFNAKKTLEQDQLADVRHIILQLQHQICEGFKALPLEKEATYSARLVSNIAMRIYRERHVPSSRKERIQFRWEKAKEFAEQIVCAPKTNYSMLKYYLVTSSIFLMPRLVNEMPRRADKIDWEWSAFWSTVLPFSVNSSASTNSSQNQGNAQDDKEEQKKIMGCCCCFGSLSILPIAQCCANSSAKTSGPSGSLACCSNQSAPGNCPCKSSDCFCNDCKAQCCCNELQGDCCCNDGCSCSSEKGGGDCCCDGGKGSGGGSGGSNGGGSGGSNGGGSGGGSNGGDSGGSNGGGNGGGGDCCNDGGGGGGCCCDGKGGGGGGGGGCCCDGKGGGGGGGGGCCCDGKGGGGGGCCCDGKGGGGGGGCCDGKGGGGGGGGGGCCDGKGGGGGGGGGCCCDGKGGGGGGGGGCCCDGKSGGGGGCCCDGKGGGGGGGNCGCCKTEIGGCDTCAPAHFESCNGVLECFFPWQC